VTKTELEKRLAESNARIAGLERKNEELAEREWDQEEREAELGAYFAALCQALDDCVPISRLPIALRFEFENLAEELGAPRSWR
jgi:hypothetical protein